MPARLVSDNQEHVVIRPLVYVSEEEARVYTRECGLEVIGCCCPVCGDLSLKRQRIKRWLIDLEREHPGIKSSMLKALGNVVPRRAALGREGVWAGAGSNICTNMTPTSQTNKFCTCKSAVKLLSGAPRTSNKFVPT